VWVSPSRVQLTSKGGVHLSPLSLESTFLVFLRLSAVSGHVSGLVAIKTQAFLKLAILSGVPRSLALFECGIQLHGVRPTVVPWVVVPLSSLISSVLVAPFWAVVGSSFPLELIQPVVNSDCMFN